MLSNFFFSSVLPLFIFFCHVTNYLYNWNNSIYFWRTIKTEQELRQIKFRMYSFRIFKYVSATEEFKHGKISMMVHLIPVDFLHYLLILHTSIALLWNFLYLFHLLFFSGWSIILSFNSTVDELFVKFLRTVVFYVFPFSVSSSFPSSLLGGHISEVFILPCFSDYAYGSILFILVL